MCASKVAAGKQRGWIIPIGGAEEQENAPQIPKRFVQVTTDTGGGQADNVVIPTASHLRRTGPRERRIFGDLGVRCVTALDFETRRDCEEPRRTDCLQRASGVCFSGGNPLRLSTLLGGTMAAVSSCRPMPTAKGM